MKIHHKVTRKGPTPLMGRQLFRGQYSPLILANNSGQSPNVYADVYNAATRTMPSTNVAPVPVAPVGVEPCQLTQDEREWCAYEPGLPFCKKMKLAKSDPECEQLSDPSLKPECPMSDLFRKVCEDNSTAFNPNDPMYEFTEFCKLKKINGMCIDEAKIDKENKEKEAEIAAEEEWKATRGCRFDNVPLQPGVRNSFIETPCNLWKSDDETDQIKTNAFRQYKFISWVPDRP
jgi:hypothetical protein